MVSAVPGKVIQNLTPRHLRIMRGEATLLLLAPLERARPLPADPPSGLTAADLEPLQRANLVRLHDTQASALFESFELIGKATFGVAVGLFFLGVILKGFIDQQVLPLPVLFWYIGVSVVIILSGVTIALLITLKDPAVVARSFAQAMSLLSILAIGLGLPAAVIYFFGGGRELLAGGFSLLLLGRIVQFLFIATASLLPALLYFLFDRQQLGTLRDRFEQQIFRLDPTVTTLVDVSAKYGKQIQDIYGPERTAGEGRLVRGTRWPTFVATLVITLGWLVTLLPVGPGPELGASRDVLGLLIPHATALTFGFLGTYFFALNTVLRRYVRGDLKPKAYSSIAVRVFVVIIVAWVLDTLYQGTTTLVISFLAGIFPETGLTLIQEWLRGGLRRPGPSGALQHEKHPLTNLDGIDLYDRARLLDEGVTNVESLAHHDLIDLMLETRIPVPRLVDWVDQAILYLHVVNEDGTEANSWPAVRTRLRRYGIRTATDLERIAGRPACQGESLRVFDGSPDEAPPGGEKPAPPAPEHGQRLRAILTALADDEWLDYVRRWREGDPMEEQQVSLLPEGRLTIRRVAIESSARQRAESDRGLPPV